MLRLLALVALLALGEAFFASIQRTRNTVRQLAFSQPVAVFWSLL